MDSIEGGTTMIILREAPFTHNPSKIKYCKINLERASTSETASLTLRSNSCNNFYIKKKALQSYSPIKFCSLAK
jgi:hypothetical protein